MTRPKRSAKRPLPQALAKNAKTLADKKQRELAAEPMYRALGHATFAELLDAELAMSTSYAERLMNIARNVRESDAMRWLEEKSAAVAELKKIAGVRSLRRNVLLLPSKEKVDLERLSAPE